MSDTVKDGAGLGSTPPLLVYAFWLSGWLIRAIQSWANAPSCSSIRRW